MDTIFKKLKEKNPKIENSKLRLWAKIIQTGHWEYYDNPPPNPLITGTPKSQSRKDNITDALTGMATAVVNALKPQECTTPKRASADSSGVKVSPMRSVTIQRSCLDDLKKLKVLHEDQVLTNEEFEEEKQQILATLRSFK